MAAKSKLKKSDTVCFAEHVGDVKRGPLTMERLQFHPSLPVLFAQCSDRDLAIFDLEAEPRKGKKGEAAIPAVRGATHDAGWIRGFMVNPNGDLLATGSSDRSLRLWRVRDRTLEAKPLATVSDAHDGWVEDARFSPDGKWLATAGSDRLVNIWQASDLKPVATIDGHTNHVRDLAWSPNGKRLLSGAEDGFVQIIDPANWEVTDRIEFGNSNEQQGQNPNLGGVYRIAISHNDRWLAVAGGKKSTLFDLESLAAVADGERADQNAAFSPRDDILAIGQSTVLVHGYESGSLRPPEPDKKGNPGRLGKITGTKIGEVKRGEWSHGLTFSPDGGTIAMGKSDGKVELWTLA